MNGLYWSLPFTMIAWIVGAAVAIQHDWCVVQSDDRNNTMTRVSFNSLHVATVREGVPHFVYKCNTLGVGKPKVILHACHSCSYVVWADADVYATERFIMSRVKHIFTRHPHVSVLAGIDFKETIRTSHANRGSYFENFNDGTMAINCANHELLDQWETYTRTKAGDDQTTLHLMASHGSLYEHAIRYEFKIFGVHSKGLEHYPGAYKNKMLKNHPSSHVSYIDSIIPCPFV